ncbi:uncharacterized protein N0V89_011232 [Didymosphaeria variabile]|uniref:Uncharacterized protein n=1 Tax=Didymosphaeria variabile TaxID=1932322 RepID=A0A9W8XDN2_9PLEO|nr:uncharacterized protein N0V89_011232 [Didymosphaeria variabile]KAJ4347292.1 hypothetical protein N0V89_011232 [Didymosphaeria variabile]
MASPLLELPGEIRNRIYKFVAAGHGRPVEVKHLKSEDKDAKVCGYGTYAGLTRVCRQIRKEFLPSEFPSWRSRLCRTSTNSAPVQQQNARVTVNLPELDIFIATFFDTRQDLPPRTCPTTQYDSYVRPHSSTATRFHYLHLDSTPASASPSSNSDNTTKAITVRIYILNDTEIPALDFQPLVRAKAQFFNQVTFHAWIQNSSPATSFETVDLEELLDWFARTYPFELQADFLRCGLGRILNMEEGLFPRSAAPAQIRNRIYKFVLADDDESVDIHHGDWDTTCLKDETGGDLEVSPGDDEKPLHNIPRAGTYAGLTRVCRQIRKEFLPMQQRNARVRLLNVGLKHFLDTFANYENPMKEIIIVMNVRYHEIIYNDRVLMSVVEAWRYPARRMVCHTVVRHYIGKTHYQEEVLIHEFYPGEPISQFCKWSEPVLAT